MDNVYIAVRCIDTPSEYIRTVSAVFKTREDARAYLQRKYKEFSEEARQYNVEYPEAECGKLECRFIDDVVCYDQIIDTETISIASVKFGEEIDLWKLS